MSLRFFFGRQPKLERNWLPSRITGYLKKLTRYGGKNAFQANALLMRPENDPPLDAGAIVRLLEIPT